MEEKIVLEDGLNYDMVDAIKSIDCTYVYLANEKDESDICIRKLKSDNALYPLESEPEVEKALLLFARKHKEDINELK